MKVILHPKLNSLMAWNKPLKALAFIQTYFIKNGYSPTTKEIKQAVGMNHSQFWKMLNDLETDGYIKRAKNQKTKGYRQRGITVNAERILK